MTPASNRHAWLQTEIGYQIRLLNPGGWILSECSIETDKGTKVADVAWLSDNFFETYGETTPYPSASELCVEIISPLNSQREMQEKRSLYFDRGAQEVWLCSEAGQLDFFSPTGNLGQSLLFPEYPTTIV